MVNFFEQIESQNVGPAFTQALTPSVETATTDPQVAQAALAPGSQSGNFFAQFEQDDVAGPDDRFETLGSIGRAFTGERKEGFSPIASGAKGVAQGASLGFIDEVLAAANAARIKLGGDERSFGEIFSTVQSELSQEFKQAQEANPRSFLGGQVVGGVGTGLAAGPAGLVARTAGRGLGTRALAGSAEGAAFGGAVGAGTSEGGFADRVRGTLTGAATGAALGGVIPPVASAVGGVVRTATRPFAEAASTASTLIADRLRNAQTDIARAVRKLERLKETAPTLTLADVGGPEVQKLLRAATNIPETTKRTALLKKLAFRKQFQFKRLGDALGVVTNQNVDEFFETAAGLGKIRKANARPLFDRAFAKPVPFTAELEEVLNRPIIRAAIPRARAAAQNRGEDFEQIFARQTGVDDAGIPTFDITSVPGVRDLHRIKMEIDAIIGNLKKRAETSSLANVSVRDATIAKKALVDAIESPEYKRALAQYAGDSAAINAAEEGLDFLKKSPEEITALIKGFDSEAERQVFRLGAARALRDAIENRAISRDAVGTILENKRNIRRITAVFPNDRRRALQLQQSIENAQNRTLAAVQGNSTTAQQLLESQRAAGVDAGDIAAVGVDVLTGGVAGASAANAARRGIVSIVRDKIDGLKPEVADEIIAQLTTAGPELAQEVADRIGRLSLKRKRALKLTDLAILGLTPGAAVAATGLTVP